MRCSMSDGFSYPPHTASGDACRRAAGRRFPSGRGSRCIGGSLGSLAPAIVGLRGFAHGDADGSTDQRPNGSPNDRAQNGTGGATGNFGSNICRCFSGTSRSFGWHRFGPQLRGRCAGSVRRVSQPDRAQQVSFGSGRPAARDTFLRGFFRQSRNLKRGTAGKTLQSLENCHLATTFRFASFDAAQVVVGQMLETLFELPLEYRPCRY